MPVERVAGSAWNRWPDVHGIGGRITVVRAPNERGEMSNLIDDVFKAFGLRLGVIDLTTLARLTLRAMRDGVTIDEGQLSQLRGFLDV